ncbi:MAG: B12-binding domain-containing radical SAM protein [Candidatus Binatia bacterium]
MRKRILIVNCFFDDSHQRIRRSWKIPQAMAPVYLAGAFSTRDCEIRLYDEVSSGALEDESLLSWPDMLVLSGLTNSLDRMLHLTAYARTKNSKVIVVAGGPAIRALPYFTKPFFDYPCLGDIEELRDVIQDAWGKAFVSERMLPRYDLAYWMRLFACVETSRYCNFHCAFCALTGEKQRYRHYGLDYVQAQFHALGKRSRVLFIDNNFYGNSRNQFLGRLQQIKGIREAGKLSGWAALVTNDFFLNPENLRLARDAGCIGLFSGVESFDAQWLRSVHKRQNTSLPQIKLISGCLDEGILFLYGVIMDVANRRLADLRAEIDFITRTPEIALPSFLTLPIPLLGTPYFHDCLARHLLLPETKLRDMDGTTLVLKPLDPIEEVVGFIRQMIGLRGYRANLVRHSLGFVRRYGARLNRFQMATALGNAALLCADATVTAPASLLHLRRAARTHVTTTEKPDEVYHPAFRVAAPYERYFRPTKLTDAKGDLVEALAADLIPRPEPKAAAL